MRGGSLQTRMRAGPYDGFGAFADLRPAYLVREDTVCSQSEPESAMFAGQATDDCRSLQLAYGHLRSGLPTAADTELAVDILEVEVHRLGGDGQAIGGLLVAQALG